MITPLPALVVEPVVRAALLEDLGRMGDVTANACLSTEDRFAGQIRARAPGVLAGVDAAAMAFTLLNPAITVRIEKPDGSTLAKGDVILRVDGPARDVLAAERVALNLLGRLSGIASLTARYVAAITGTSARIAATRKTTPNLRSLEKYAVQCGGGWPHRFGLDDAILIKDNHIAACGGVDIALTRARAHAGHMMVVEVEVDTLDQLAQALPHKPHVILLDNFSIADLRDAVAMAKGTVVLEASGGVSLDTVAAIAATGVDVISVGALTHSAPTLDLGLDAI